MRVERKTKANNEISTSSMPDIIFMLLIFFMVTTVMREFDGLDVIIPNARMLEKLENKRHTVYIWATKDEVVSVNDIIVNIDGDALSAFMYKAIVNDPQITVSLKTDEDASMEFLSKIHTQLRKANALKISYSTLTESAQ